MEGNFYVSTHSVDITPKGKLAQAYPHCPEESAKYGACVKEAHFNKVLNKNSCVEQRLALRKCIDARLALNRAHTSNSSSSDNAGVVGEEK